MLLAENLRKRYGPVAALDGFALRVAGGEIAGLIGPNGAGKTTFVDVAAGLVRPDAGRVLLDGVDVARHPGAARHRLGLAPQHLALYPTATVRQNLRLFGGLAGLRRAALRRAMDEVVAATALAGTLDRPVRLLSGGQQRRAQTAGALLHRPAVLLLDEPTVGADPDTRQALLSVVTDRARAGAAVCYTTHYLPELADLGATIAVARAGRVIARGTADELLSGLSGQLRLAFAGPVPERVRRAGADVDAAGTGASLRTRTPGADLARLTRELAADTGAPELVSVDVLRPDLDDLFRSLREVSGAAA